MRLLLDEQVAKVVADTLRARGHDVVAVTEEQGLLHEADRRLLARAFDSGRVIVTYDAADFRRAAAERFENEESHSGLVLVSPERFPQGSRYVGALIAALDLLLRSMPAEDALRDREWWLEQPGV